MMPNASSFLTTSFKHRKSHSKLSSNSCKNIYAFDRVFAPSESNEVVYKESVESEIETAIEGYNTSIMLYGVTGSGKTHTVFGNLGYRNPDPSDQENGIVYYCFKRLSREKNCELKASYLEIYNEQVIDLLGDDDNLKITENGSGEVVVQGLSQKSVTRFEELISIVKAGNLRRKMAATSANAFSSRSHAILQITIKRKVEGGYLRSKLSFIDLAGSERVALTQNKGLRLAEGSNINKSLLALGKVITSLSEKNSDSYINFRDSKLTRLLKDSLGGNTKTILITCIGTHSQQVDETIQSLNYATRAKKIKLTVVSNLEIEAPRPPENPSEYFSDQNQLVKAYMSQIAVLKGQIGQLQTELEKEKGGRSEVENNYKILVKDIEEQWELKATVLELGELIASNQEKLTKKKKLLVQQDANEIKQKRLLIEEIHELERIINENQQIKRELEKRLEAIEEKKACKLGLAKRSVSPLIMERALKRSQKRDEEEKEQSFVSLKPNTVQVSPMNERATEKKTTSKAKSIMVTDPGNSQHEASEDCQDKGNVLPKLSPSQVYHTISGMSQSDYEICVGLEHDYGDLPVSSAKAPKDIKKTINFDAITLDKPKTTIDLFKPEFDDESHLDYNSMHRQFKILSDPQHSSLTNSREHKIQQKLQQAREKMREFKKKLHMMGEFLVKYEEKAMQRGSLDILKAVVVLLLENQKQKYVLTDEETDIIGRMEIFVDRFRFNNPDIEIPFTELVQGIVMNHRDKGKENLKPILNKSGVNMKPEKTEVSEFNPILVEDMPLKSKAEIKEKYQSTLKNTNSLKGLAQEDLNKTDFLISKINKLLN